MNIIAQSLVPKCLLSRIVGKLASQRLGFLTRWAIRLFIRRYGVNMQEAEISDYRQFSTFNDFFTRALKSDARVLVKDDNAVISPVDGCVSACGYLQKDQILQAKGAYFSVNALCAGDETVGRYFENGAFLTTYLSPKDYHRFHMPISGQLKKIIYVPGKLFSVNPTTVNAKPGLFANNERVICVFETAIGKMAVIAVGAMIVGSVAIEGQGIIARGKTITSFPASQHFSCGDVLGCFRLGSTILALFEENKIHWDASIQQNSALHLYQKIGHLNLV